MVIILDPFIGLLGGRERNLSGRLGGRTGLGTCCSASRADSSKYIGWSPTIGAGEPSRSSLSTPPERLSQVSISSRVDVRSDAFFLSKYETNVGGSVREELEELVCVIAELPSVTGELDRPLLREDDELPSEWTRPFGSPGWLPKNLSMATLAPSRGEGLPCKARYPCGFVLVLLLLVEEELTLSVPPIPTP